MNENDKAKLPQYTVDFVTALPVRECRERLERGLSAPVNTGLSSALAPITQETQYFDDSTFVIERTFPGAIHPIRLAGHLDPRDGGSGTWVHGAITHDTYNQVIIEGLLAFAGFFVLSTLFFLRLKEDGILLALVVFLPELVLWMLRWRALNRATEDTARWMRRRLYVTRDQLNKDA